MQYELFYLVGERNELNLDAIREEVSQLLISEKATLVEPELTEKRKLAYEIKHQNRGTYVTRRFEMPEIDYWANQEETGGKEFGIEVITKKLNLTNTILRFMIVKTEGLPDLGAKEKRQQMEQKDGKGIKKETKPQRQESKTFVKREAPKVVEKVIPKVEVTASIKEKEVEIIEVAKEEVKPEVVKPKATKKTSKKESEDIDEQLEKLLNI
jgi:ribosomal protein S6